MGAMSATSYCVKTLFLFRLLPYRTKNSTPAYVQANSMGNAK